MIDQLWSFEDLFDAVVNWAASDAKSYFVKKRTCRWPILILQLTFIRPIKDARISPRTMIKARDFSIATVQAVAFTPDRSALVPAKVLGSIMARFADRFNGDVQVIPIPKELPDEIPRLELKSEDNRWVFNSSFARMSAVWSAQGTDDSPPPAVVSECAQVISHFFSQQASVQVNRLAFIVQRVATGDELAHELISRFCKQEMCDADSRDAPLRHSRAFQIHNLKKYESPMTGVSLNSWVRCKTAISDDPTATDKVLFEQDINTPHDDLERRFSPQQITEFFAMAQLEADQILKLYFSG